MLIPTSYDDLCKKLTALSDWKIIYKDESAIVFIPKSKDKGNWIKVPKNFDAQKEKYISNIKI